MKNLTFLIAAGMASPLGAISLNTEISFGGSSDDVVFAIQTTETAIYFAGVTNSDDFPVTDGSTYRGDPDGVGDIFVAKTDLAGTIQWATYLGGSGTDFGNGIVVDAQGVVTVSGYTSSTDFPTLNPIQANNAGKTDGVMAQFDTEGNLLFASYLGGSEDDQFADVALESTTDSFAFVGFTASTDFPFPVPNGPNADETKTFTSDVDGLFVALNRDRTLRSARYLDLRDGMNTIILDATDGVSGQVWICGQTDDTDFYDDSLFGRSDPKGGQEAFVMGLDVTTGRHDEPFTFGGSGDDIAHGVAFQFSRVAVVGQTNSTDLSNSFGTVPQFTNAGGDNDGFIYYFDLNGTELAKARSSYLGGAGNDIIRAVAADTTGAFHIAGVTSSTDFPLPAAPETPTGQATFGGGPTDGFAGIITAQSGIGGNTAGIVYLSGTYAGFDGEEGFTAVDYDRSGDGFGFPAFFPVAFGAGRAPDPEPMALDSPQPLQIVEGKQDEIFGGITGEEPGIPDTAISIDTAIEQSETHYIGETVTFFVEISDIGGLPRSNVNAFIHFESPSHAFIAARTLPGVTATFDESRFGVEILVAELPAGQSTLIEIDVEVVDPPTSSAVVAAMLTVPDGNPTNDEAFNEYGIAASLADVGLNAFVEELAQIINAPARFRVEFRNFSEDPAINSRVLVQFSSAHELVQTSANLGGRITDVSVPGGAFHAFVLEVDRLGPFESINFFFDLIARSTFDSGTATTGALTSDSMDDNLENNELDEPILFFFDTTDGTVADLSAFVDASGDGMFDEGIDSTANLSVDVLYGGMRVETVEISDGAASTRVPDGEPGMLRAIAPAGFVFSTPKDGVFHFIGQKDEPINVSFGLFELPADAGAINGCAFKDRNQDLLLEDDEDPAPETQIYIDSNRSGAFDPGEPASLTGPDGGYFFGGLTPGDYIVRMVLPADAVQTVPAPTGNTQLDEPTVGVEVNVVAGQLTPGPDFGLTLLQEIIVAIRNPDENGDIILCWPESVLNSLQAERNSGLAPADWLPIDATPIVENGQAKLKVTPLGAIEFYRLIKAQGLAIGD